ITNRVRRIARNLPPKRKERGCKTPEARSAPNATTAWRRSNVPAAVGSRSAAGAIAPPASAVRRARNRTGHKGGGAGGLLIGLWVPSALTTPALYADGQNSSARPKIGVPNFRSPEN